MNNLFLEHKIDTLLPSGLSQSLTKGFMVLMSESALRIGIPGILRIFLIHCPDFHNMLRNYYEVFLKQFRTFFFFYDSHLSKQLFLMFSWLHVPEKQAGSPFSHLSHVSYKTNRFHLKKSLTIKLVKKDTERKATSQMPVMCLCKVILLIKNIIIKIVYRIRLN